VVFDVLPLNSSSYVSRDTTRGTGLLKPTAASLETKGKSLGLSATALFLQR